jgi:hypothetical protein
MMRFTPDNIAELITEDPDIFNEVILENDRGGGMSRDVRASGSLSPEMKKYQEQQRAIKAKQQAAPRPQVQQNPLGPGQMPTPKLQARQSSSGPGQMPSFQRRG